MLITSIYTLDNMVRLVPEFLLSSIRAVKVASSKITPHASSWSLSSKTAAG